MAEIIVQIEMLLLSLIFKTVTKFRLSKYRKFFFATFTFLKADNHDVSTFNYMILTFLIIHEIGTDNSRR